MYVCTYVSDVLAADNMKQEAQRLYSWQVLYTYIQLYAYNLRTSIVHCRVYRHAQQQCCMDLLFIIVLKHIPLPNYNITIVFAPLAV